MEGQSQKLKAQKKVDAKSVAEDDQEGKSAEVVLLVLDGFLDAEQHGGEPLIQPGNGVKFFHLVNGRTPDSVGD